MFLINSKRVDALVGIYFPLFLQYSSTVLGIQGTQGEVVPARSWGCRKTGSEKLSGSEPGYPKGFHQFQNLKGRFQMVFSHFSLGGGYTETNL